MLSVLLKYIRNNNDKLRNLAVRKNQIVYIQMINNGYNLNTIVDDEIIAKYSSKKDNEKLVMIVDDSGGDECIIANVNIEFGYLNSYIHYLNGRIISPFY